MFTVKMSFKYEKQYYTLSRTSDPLQSMNTSCEVTCNVLMKHHLSKNDSFLDRLQDRMLGAPWVVC